MNTLTISIALLALVALLAVAVHSAWQSYSGHRLRKAGSNATDSDDAGAIANGSGMSQKRLRSEPSLDTVLAQDSATDAITDLNDALIAQEYSLPADDHVAPRQPLLAAQNQAAAFEFESAPVSEDTLVGVNSTAASSASVSSALISAALASSAAVNPALAGSALLNSTPTDPAALIEAGSDTAPIKLVVKAGPAASHLDERVDCIVEFALELPVSGQRLLHATQTIRRFGSKAAGFDGMISTDGATTDSASPAPPWQLLDPAYFYRSFRMGVLLANRHGALNAMEFAEFADTASKLAAHFSALAVIPDMTRTLEYARQLDAECIKLDAQLGLNIDCASALNLSELTRIAREQGLIERGSHRYARIGRQDELLFTLSPADSANRLTLLLDVPRAPIDQQPWAALLSCAHETMTGLRGHLVDDAGRPLNTRNLDSLSAELAQRYAMLDQSGFKAGSALAMRVFN